MNRLILFSVIFALAACSTLKSSPATDGASIYECSQKYFDGLSAEADKAEMIAESSRAAAERDPTDENWRKAADAAGTSSAATANLAAAHANCSPPARAGR